MEKQDFAEAARNMAGSRDTGAQLLCCMLRSIGVETRLVCSLQPFQFRAVEKTATPQKQYSAYVPYSRSRQTTPEQNRSDQASGVKVETDRTPNGQKLVDRRKGKLSPILRYLAYIARPKETYPRIEISHLLGRSIQ